MKRLLPGPIPLETFEGTIKVFEDFIGPRWLNAQPIEASPLSEIWNRTDHLASLELFTIADSYAQIAPRAVSRWLDEYKKAVKSHNVKDTLSQTYELISAAMFSYEHEVSLCEPSFPGYDFTISEAGKTIRVSCKKLLASDGEKFFYKHACDLYEHIRATACRLRASNVQMVMWLRDQNGQPPVEHLKEVISETLRIYIEGGDTDKLQTDKLGGWVMQVNNADNCPEGSTVDAGQVSTRFLCLAPFRQDEQKRFENLFRRASTNLKRHGQPINADNINVIMIGLPPAVSIARAKKWLSGKLSRENTSITAVILNRFIPIIGDGSSGPSVQYEFALILNPNASVTWQEFAAGGISLGAKLPIGNVQDVTEAHEMESYAAIKIDGSLINVGDCYVFQRGEVYCRTDPGMKDIEITVPQESGVQYNYIIELLTPGNAMAIEFNTPPHHALVLL